jgi:GGDEF domain-containing protein
VVLVLLIVGRQLVTVLDNQALNRRLASMVGTLEQQAFHGGLTNLPNRALFRERVGHALRRRSQAGTPPALLFIDLDDFKMVNDQLGHAAGDDLLMAVAGRILEAMRPPFSLGERQVQVGASVGVTISEATEVDAVLREADVAMYTAKARFELAPTSVQADELDTVGTIPET